jgi:hypothetical protein
MGCYQKFISGLDYYHSRECIGCGVVLLAIDPIWNKIGSLYYVSAGIALIKFCSG